MLWIFDIEKYSLVRETVLLSYFLYTDIFVRFLSLFLVDKNAIWRATNQHSAIQTMCINLSLFTMGMAFLIVVQRKNVSLKNTEKAVQRRKY